jgi:MFS family permease
VCGMALPSNPSSASLWRPLRSSIFRNLLLADVISDIGTFMQSVGAAWLMVSLNAGPMYVALTQTASALPFFILALPAGAIGDIVDRRKVILFTEIWMVVVAVMLAVMTITGTMSPVLLLILTFALSAGDAFETPTWRAVLPELVQKEDLPAASALNGIEFNFARAVGPALAVFVIAFVGIGAAFLLNTLSFFGVILVVARWKRPAVKRATPPETVTGATVAAIRYVRYSPAVRIVLSADVIVSAGIAIFGLTTIRAGALGALSPLGALMLIGGAAWISFISLFNVQVLNQTPDWVRARVLAVSMLVFQGAVAAGSATWGAVAAGVGLGTALLWAGIGTILSTVLGLFLRLPDMGIDLTPWNHWRVPSVVDADAAAAGSGHG